MTQAPLKQIPGYDPRLCVKGLDTQIGVSNGRFNLIQSFDFLSECFCLDGLGLGVIKSN